MTDPAEEAIRLAYEYKHKMDEIIKELETRNEALEIQVQEIKRYAEEVLRISDRKHEAWDGLKQALTNTLNPAEWVRKDSIEVVATVNRNSAGQISMRSENESYFDMSKYVGETFYRIKGE